MGQDKAIDIAFDFRSDTPIGGDPVPSFTREVRLVEIVNQIPREELTPT